MTILIVTSVLAFARNLLTHIIFKIVTAQICMNSALFFQRFYEVGWDYLLSDNDCLQLTFTACISVQSLTSKLGKPKPDMYLLIQERNQNYLAVPHCYMLSNHWHFMVFPKMKASFGKWALPKWALLVPFLILQNQFSQWLKKNVIKGCNKTVHCITFRDTYLEVYEYTKSALLTLFLACLAPTHFLNIQRQH